MGKSDYGHKNAHTESYLQQQLHTRWCTDPTKVGNHLDTMIEVRDSLLTQSIDMNDSIFNNTIISSIPNKFRPTIDALVIVTSKHGEVLTPAELIATIHTEARGGYVKCNEQKREFANYVGNTSN